MKKRIFLIILTVLFLGCKREGRNIQVSTFFAQNNSKNTLINPDGKTIQTRFNVPENYKRFESSKGSFAYYLQNFPLKPHDSKVYLYNGNLKYRQDVHAAVLDISVGEKDLQQCADATMRLRAEYLFDQKEFDKIHFNFTNGFNAEYSKWHQGFRTKVDGNKVNWIKSATNEDSKSYTSFLKYMETVFTYAGTLSLENELSHRDLKDIQIGDVFVKGGSPGHAIIVVDLAENETGNKIILLAQSYMPAQNIHILKNPNNSHISPWYDLNNLEILETPEWNFSTLSLKKWD